MSFLRPASNAPTRRVAPSHEPWHPLPYMLRGIEHLVTHRSAGLPLKPGGRKTSITLAAFSQLKEAGTVQSMLVIAPLRVCRQVWRQEAAKWTQFRHLKFGLLHGPKKDEVLRKGGCDIYLLNPEGVVWLCKQFTGRPLPFDIVTIDELTRFKNQSSERSKALRPRIDRTSWRWGLTGSLAPNGYMDVFGQQLVLDGGAALGRYITHFRDQYFRVGHDGFSYDLMPGADARITARLAPYWMYVDEHDYAQLPDLVDNPIMLDLDKASRATYDKMKKELLAELPDGMVTAANQAACYSKLSQMANGSVYTDGTTKRGVAHIHDIKLDALEELVEELAGEPLLVGYEFNHDLDRLRERFGVVDKATGKKVIPYLGKGTTAKQEDEWIAAWNRGELPILCAHPASAGHGLNMQGANACNVAWFGITWDFELFDQFIRRVMRSGNTSAQVFNHLLIVRGTIDELKLAALRDKDMTQNRLLKALNTQILREVAETQAGGDNPSNFVTDDRRLPNMVQRLSRQVADPNAGQGFAQQGHAVVGPATDGPVTPRGWGARATTQPVENTQRERIAAQLSPQEQAKSAFSGAVTQATEAVQNGDYGAVGGADVPEPNRYPNAGGNLAADGGQLNPPVTRSRRKAPSVVETPEPVEVAGAEDAAVDRRTLQYARLDVLKIAFADPNTALEDGLDIARSLMEFVAEG